VVVVLVKCCSSQLVVRPIQADGSPVGLMKAECQ